MIEKFKAHGRLVSIGLLLGAAFLAVTLIVAGRVLDFERPYTYAKDYEEAIVLGLVRQGWIPGHMPETMLDIHERHDLDTSDSVMRFTMSLEDFEAFLAMVPSYSFRPIDYVDSKHIQRAKNWLPPSENAPAIDEADYECFLSNRMRVAHKAYLAVHYESRTCYFWLN